MCGQYLLFIFDSIVQYSSTFTSCNAYDRSSGKYIIYPNRINYYFNFLKSFASSPPNSGIIPSIAANMN